MADKQNQKNKPEILFAHILSKYPVNQTHRPLLLKLLIYNLNYVMLYVNIKNRRGAKIMTLLQEAYTLMQGQPETNIQWIVDLLQTMSLKKEVTNTIPDKIFKRTGLAKEMVNLPDDFDVTFDALDKDMEELFFKSPSPCLYASSFPHTPQSAARPGS